MHMDTKHGMLKSGEFTCEFHILTQVISFIHKQVNIFAR